MVSTRPSISVFAHPPIVLEDAAQFRAARRSASLRRARQERADVVTMGTLIACAALICLLGAAWLASYARLSWQASELHQVQQSLTQAKEHHEALTQQVARLQSENRIRFLAAGMKMVPGGASHYLTPEASPSRLALRDRSAHAQQVADAR